MDQTSKRIICSIIAIGVMGGLTFLESWLVPEPRSQMFEMLININPNMMAFEALATTLVFTLPEIILTLLGYHLLRFVFGSAGPSTYEQPRYQ